MKYFMGHKVYEDPCTQQYVIDDGLGNRLKVDKHAMESDNDYMMAIADEVKSWTDNSTYITNGTIPKSAIASSKPDLRDVSTRDLLNEAFRRGAIKQLELKQVVSKHMVDDYGEDYMKHLHTKLRQDALVSRVDELEKAGVFNVGKREGGNHPLDDVEFSIDYFICKHPLTLKKEEPYADR